MQRQKKKGELTEKRNSAGQAVRTVGKRVDVLAKLASERCGARVEADVTRVDAI